VLCGVAMDGHTLEEEDILAFLRQKLAAYKLPRKILLFAESDLSFTGTQKIQSGKLIEQALLRLRDEAIEIDGVNYGDYLVDSGTPG
jgi:fatty-acyl-CoA synthase